MAAVPPPPPSPPEPPARRRTPWWVFVVVALLATLVLLAGIIVVRSSDDEAAQPIPTVTSPPSVPSPTDSPTTESAPDVEIDDAGTVCERHVGRFLRALEELDSRLSVGLTFEQYTQQVADVRVEYDRVPFKRIDVSCTLAVGVPAENALNLYVKANNTWNRCIGNFGCDIDGIDPTLQRDWRKASREIRKARRGLADVA